ncbi:MAG: hypothetical protein CMK59_05235 [Proteobacteria bacterium]|nr:hypothetical protein [Pseudomonadota bacterium]
MRNPLSKRVQIDVSLSRPKSARDEFPRLCVFGVVPFDSPVISQVAPHASIRRSASRVEGPYVEQVRLSSHLQAAFLPSLAQKSRLYDSLSSILDSGAPEVDFILARIPGRNPWDLAEPDVVGMFVPYMNINQGSVCLFPDAGGPWPRSITSNEEYSDFDDRIRRLRQALQAYAVHLSDNFQIGLMDLPYSYKRMVDPIFASEWPEVFHSLQGSDVGLCSWAGSFLQLRRHGWRSPASTLAGYVSSRTDLLTQSLIGHQIALGRGRNVIENRAVQLGAPAELPISPIVEENSIVLSIDKNKAQARVLSEMTCRRPMLEWSVPVLRTVKAIHQSLTRAAELFVFRPVQDIEAVALQSALELVLTPYYNLGIIVGSDGSGAPEVTAAALPDYAEPMLSADLSAQIRPWCQSISLRVMVKSGSQPVIEEV